MDIKNNTFDTKVSIKVDILPQKHPENISEELVWEKINHILQHQAFLLADSLEKYFQYLAESEIKFRVNTKELKEDK